MFDLFYCFDLGNGASDICQLHRKIRWKHFAVHAQFANRLTETWNTNQEEKEDLMISKKQKRMILATE